MNCKNNLRSQDIAIVLPSLEHKKTTVSFTGLPIPSPRESMHGHSPVHPLSLILGFINMKRSQAQRFENNSTSCWESFKTQVIKDTNEKENPGCPTVKQKALKIMSSRQCCGATEKEKTLAFF